MANQITSHQQIANYMGKAIQNHFGKGPKNIHVVVDPPYVTMYIKGFLLPTEHILLHQDQEHSVMKTREMIVEELSHSIQPEVERLVQGSIRQWYADWNLDAHTGMIWATLDQPREPSQGWPGHLNQRVFERKINNFSTRGQKEPETIQTYWLDNHTIMIERTGVFVEIEKALIEQGFMEELKIAKRPLERKLFREEHMEALLQRQVLDIFTDWDWENDKGYMVLALQREQNKRF